MTARSAPTLRDRDGDSRKEAGERRGMVELGKKLCAAVQKEGARLLTQQRRDRDHLPQDDFCEPRDKLSMSGGETVLREYQAEHGRRYTLSFLSTTQVPRRGRGADQLSTGISTGAQVARSARQQARFCASS